MTKEMDNLVEQVGSVTEMKCMGSCLGCKYLDGITSICDIDMDLIMESITEEVDV